MFKDQERGVYIDMPRGLGFEGGGPVAASHGTESQSVCVVGESEEKSKKLMQVFCRVKGGASQSAVAVRWASADLQRQAYSYEQRESGVVL